MAQSDHRTIRNYMQKMASGQSDARKRMVYDPVDRKFKVADQNERFAGDAQVVTPEDMISFGPVWHV
ncbi:hypothetical protein [Micromonospora sp. NPDC005203]|uniref:hypothetical protein n=1 Tax=Micromonospora sp. NPDC005203 TaxID=3364226 RepID=UPI0036980766